MLVPIEDGKISRHQATEMSWSFGVVDAFSRFCLDHATSVPTSNCPPAVVVNVIDHLCNIIPVEK